MQNARLCLPKTSDGELLTARCGKHGYSRNALIETLHTVQSSFGFLDEPSIRFVAQSLRVPLSQAYGVVTFYHFFSLKPPGKHTCTICMGTACYIKGAEKLVAEAEKQLQSGGRDDSGRKHVAGAQPAAWATAGGRRWCC